MRGCLLPAVVLAVVACVFGRPAGAAGETPRPAWALPVQEAIEPRPLDALTETCTWEDSGGPEGHATRVESAGGKHALRFEVRVDHSGSGAYPVGWPSCQARLDPPLAWSGYDAIQFRVRAECDDPKLPLPVRIIVHGAKLQELLPMMEGGQTCTALIPFPKGAELGKIPLIHFFIAENEYPDKAHVTFTASDFRLVKLRTRYRELPPAEAGVELFVGPGAEAVLLPPGSPTLSGTAVVHTGARCALSRAAQLRFTAEELFSGRHLRAARPVPRGIAPGRRVEVPFRLPLGARARPGYYWLTCDLVENGRSRVGGRVGFEDLYLEQAGEAMAHAMLSLRTGMGLYIIDPIGGYGAGSAAFLHTYDPRDAARYLDFIRAYRGDTGKHAEGLEAGVAGTVFAAHAFRAAGEADRARFAEKLLKSNCDFMLRHMQDPDGGTRTWVNAYYDRHAGEYENTPSGQGARDTNQIGEWLRPVARTILYLRTVPGEEATVRRLYAAARRAGDYLVGVTTDAVGPREHVIRHFGLSGAGAETRRSAYVQEGRQCDVYLGRAMAGLSYFAYVRQLREGSVPQAYLDALRDTTEWALEKMQKETGWFDWQCGYEVEGGCHAFLGNLYLAEGAQGYYLLCAARRDAAGARLAAECARRALHFITDHERLYRPVGLGVLEFWGGPYLYWQLTEYLGSIGPDTAMRAHLAAMHRGWAEERRWKDFTQRAGEGMVYRADGLSHLTMSVPAYPALRLMEDLGKPFRYGVPGLAALDATHGP